MSLFGRGMLLPRRRFLLVYSRLRHSPPITTTHTKTVLPSTTTQKHLSQHAPPLYFPEAFNKRPYALKAKKLRHYDWWVVDWLFRKQSRFVVLFKGNLFWPGFRRKVREVVLNGFTALWSFLVASRFWQDSCLKVGEVASSGFTARLPSHQLHFHKYAATNLYSRFDWANHE